MAPKKAAASTKKAAAPSAHPSYADMIKEAVISLKEKGGSSRQSIKKYVLANNNLAGATDAAFTTNLNKALQKGSENGTFVRPKGASGPVKLGAPSKAAATKAPAAKKAPATKAKTTKTAAAKKAPTKKTTAKSAATKKAPAKKAAASKTKSKANTSKVRKTPALAPAVEDKKPVALTKTKSGRVQKSTAPMATAKKAAPKKAAAKKAAPKKAAAKKA